MKLTKADKRKRIHYRVRKKVNGSPARPRLSVYRSNKFIYCQLIDDLSGQTIASASSREASVAKDVNKVEQSKQVGKLIAERAKALNLNAMVFDRGGYLYHGRVKALSDGVREMGVHI